MALNVYHERYKDRGLEASLQRTYEKTSENSSFVSALCSLEQFFVDILTCALIVT